MSSPATRIPLTVREYRLLPEDGRRWELFEGDFLVTPAPTPLHQKISRRLQHALMTQLEDTGLAQVIDAPIDVIFDDFSVVQPDLVIVSTAHASLITARAVEGAPDVLVEILSPSSIDRDRYLKLRLYERFGVREYWIVDPEHGFLEAYRLGANPTRSYELRERHDRASILRCPDFPTLELPLAPLFT
jgi:Uma2 family endonuclease